MTRPADRIARLALRLLPPDRKDWGRAMVREVAAIDSEAEAGRFALGCLSAAYRERFEPVQAFVLVGRLGVGAVTAAYGAAHLYFASRGVQIALGTLEPASGAPVGKDLGVLLVYMLAMGSTHLAAAFFLVRWSPKAFVIAFSCAFAVASVVNGATLIWMIITDTVFPTVWGWQFVPLLMLGGAAALFAATSRARRRRPSL